MHIQRLIAQNGAHGVKNGVKPPKSHACAHEGHMGAMCCLCKYLDKVGGEHIYLIKDSESTQNFAL